MPTLKFRFNTECQMTLSGQSYEEAYLKFKDFIHGDEALSAGDGVEVYPPEDPTVYFEVEEQANYNTIRRFKGDFVEDVVDNVPDDLKERIAHPGRVA
ncbi:MAG: hypothetical protein ACODAC_08485 [Pseudomonadota bacterium]